MNVQVIDGLPGNFAHIDSDVESVGFVSFKNDLPNEIHGTSEFGCFFRRSVKPRGAMSAGND
jgi:hypothetical protein